MKNKIKTLYLTLCIGLALVVAGCGGSKETKNVTDLEAFRAKLKEQVANGELSLEEAHVKLAEATKKNKSGSRAKKKFKSSPALKALGAELTGKVTSGDMTAEDAKAKWIEAAKTERAKSKGGAKSNPKGTQDLKAKK